jgi:hypothetical protein
MLVCIEQMTTELNSWTSGSAAAHKARHNATLSMHCVIFTNTVTNLSHCHTLLHLSYCLHCATSTSCVFIVFNSLRYPYNVVLVRVLLVLLSHCNHCQSFALLSLLCPTLYTCHHQTYNHTLDTDNNSNGQVANSASQGGANFTAVPPLRCMLDQPLRT